MGHIRTVAHFDAPVERVFDVAIDVKLIPRYMTSVKDVTDGVLAPRAGRARCRRGP